jgi:hypothetical protein
MHGNHIKRMFGAYLMSMMIAGIIPVSLKAQIFTDTTVMRHIRKGIDYTYNLHFKEAHSEADEIRRMYPDHPVNLVFRAIIMYWEKYPLTPSSAGSSDFEEMLHSCIELCEKNYKVEHDAEILLTDMSARGMLLLYYSDNGLSRKIIGMAGSTYHYLKRCFGYTSVSPDFYFFTGLYKFYREEYPEIHPIYRPIASLFPKGNKAEGIKELEISSVKSVFLKADSYSFLTWIFTNFEKDFPRAIGYIKTLSELYPENYSFSVTYINNLILSKRYDEAENLIHSISGKMTNQFMLAQTDIMNGILQENKYKNPEAARVCYEKGIGRLSGYGAIGNEFSALGYEGLSRICGSEGDQQGMKKNHRKADELRN